MTSITDDVQSLYDVALTQIGSRIQKVLHEAGVDSEVRRSVAAEVSYGPYTQLFSGLTTASQQLAYYKRHFNFVVSPVHCICVVIELYMHMLVSVYTCTCT